MKENYCKQDLLKQDLQIILDHVPRMVMLIDTAGKIVYWNREGERLFGYDTEEVVGKPIWTLYSEYGRSNFDGELQQLRNGKEVTFETIIQHKNGSEYWLDIKRILIQSSSGEELVLSTASDISLLKQTEQNLSESRARTEAILEAAVEGIFIVSRHGYIKRVNKAVEEMFGYDTNEIVGQHVNSLILHPDNNGHGYSSQDEWNDRIGKGQEVRAIHKRGSIFPVELTINQVEFRDEVFFTGLIRDISTRRKLENKVIQIAEDERRRIGQELHDGLGQMLSAIRLISSNLAKKMKANGIEEAGEVMEISNMIKEADMHARNLAHGLAHIELENEGLKAAIERLCQRFERFSNLQCKCIYPEDLQLKDQRISLHLYRIIQEAMTNAAKHGNASHISVCFRREDGNLKVYIDDDGVGFIQAEKKEKSCGMGISTMRYRAHILGGTLSLKSSPIGGTQVFCRIPLQQLELFKRGH